MGRRGPRPGQISGKIHAMMRTLPPAASWAVRLALTAVLCLSVLAACSPAPTPTAPTATETPAQPPSPDPTQTPTPLPAKAVLITAGADAQTAQQAAEMLSAAAASAGLLSETREQVQPAEIGPEWKAVIFLSAPQNLAELTAAAPQTQFLAVTGQDTQAAGNLSVVRVRPEFQAFVAGYLSVITAADWRSAALLPNDGPLGTRLEEAYKNGGAYFCGICNSVYGPIMRFPAAISLPSSSDAVAWQAAVDELNKNYIYLYYVSAEAARDVRILPYLASQNIILIGAQTPPAEVMPRWAATLQFDILTPLQEALPQVLAGQGGQALNAGLRLVDTQSGLISPARLGMAEKVIQELGEGWVEPFTPPLQ